ncbi:MAG: hypothetical protein ACE1ZQ_01470 [Ignavibacteriaceae bacterium]
MQVTTIELYIHNFLAITTTVFIVSTTPLPSFIASKNIIYIPIHFSLRESSLPSKIAKPNQPPG